jgi:hypothetical protein
MHTYFKKIAYGTQYIENFLGKEFVFLFHSYCISQQIRLHGGNPKPAKIES